VDGLNQLSIFSTGDPNGPSDPDFWPIDGGTDGQAGSSDPHNIRQFRLYWVELICIEF